MSEDNVGSSAPIVSVRPGHNRLAQEDRALQAAKRERKKAKQGRLGTDGQRGAGGGDAHGDIDGNVSVLGIPNEEMTDNVRGAIQTLLDEISHLRGELSRAKHHEAYLEEQAEKDRLLHVMRRRAFIARLGLAVRRTEEEGVQFAFLYIQIGNAAQVRGDFGHGAADNLMVQAANALREGSEAGDVIGSLENYDFGLILPGNSLDEGENKAAKLMAVLTGRSFTWQGQTVGIEAQFGDTILSPNDGADELIERAKENMRARATASSLST
ncbi:MAG: GGDEF domain-containing protein [Magnetovibrio sp.]|nr:GGDEF domain-containing protein [Magnetovibrio sp.]